MVVVVVDDVFFLAYFPVHHKQHSMDQEAVLDAQSQLQLITIISSFHKMFQQLVISLPMVDYYLFIHTDHDFVLNPLSRQE